jgi:type IV pilus assembly protein PilA
MLKRTRKGMTLLELIVVIVILGILAAIAIPTFLAVINKSKYSSLETTAHAVDSDALALAGFTASPVSSLNYTTAKGEVGGSDTFSVSTGTGTPTVCVSNGSLSVLLTSSGTAGASGTVQDYTDPACVTAAP